MYSAQIKALSLLIKQLTALVATLTTLVSSGGIPRHFGAALPNVSVTSTQPASQTGQIPYFSSFDGSTFAITSSSLGFGVNSGLLQVPTSTFGAGGLAATSVSNVSQINCATSSAKLGAIAPAATTTFQFSITGVSTSTNQVYWAGINTSTPGFANLGVLGYVQSSTPNGLSVTFINASGTGNTASIAAGNSNVTASACFMQFF